MLSVIVYNDAKKRSDQKRATAHTRACSGLPKTTISYTDTSPRYEVVILCNYILVIFCF